MKIFKFFMSNVTITYVESYRSHFRETLLLASPITFSLISQKVINVTDVIMLGSVGPHALASGGLATTFFFTIMTLMHGMLSPLTVLVSRAVGEKLHKNIPDIYGSTLLIAGILAIPFFLVMSNLEPLLLLCGTQAAIAHDAGLSASVLRWAVPGAMFGLGIMRAILPAIGGAHLLMRVALIIMFFNILFNYIFINGFWLFPAQGFIGSALATTATINLIAVSLLVIIYTRPHFTSYLRGGVVKTEVVREIFAMGIPVSAILGVEAMVFLVAGLCISAIDPESLAAHQIVFSIVDTLFMLPLALSTVANVRVSFWAGAGRNSEVTKAASTAICFGILTMGICASLLYFSPLPILKLYMHTAQQSLQNSEGKVITLLAIASAFQIGDGVVSIASGCLRGLKDVRIPLVLATCGYWGVAFPTGYWLAKHQHLGAIGIWLGLTLGVSLLAIALLVRFYQLRPRTA
ncbi:MATE family efflux transporter [Vibrio anguillarum]|nr:MATE family efflux transporter [Vibrio anguillarum]